MAGMLVLCTMVHGWDARTVYHGAWLGCWYCVPWCMAGMLGLCTMVHGWDAGTVYHGARGMKLSKQVYEISNLLEISSDEYH